jgi:hypothetical protein
MPIIDERHKEIPPEDSEDIVRLWWWNPGGGASTRRVFREDLDEIRQDLRAQGATTWITGDFVVGIAD